MKIKPALRTPAEIAAHQEFFDSDKQPNDYRILAARLETIANRVVVPRPDLLEDARVYRKIANDLDEMTNETEY